MFGQKLFNVKPFLLIRLCLLSVCLIQTSFVFANPDKPSNVSALIYSSSALELFWTPASGSLVEITRNGQTLGTYDARSLFQSNLSNTETYNYGLRSVAADGSRSDVTVLSLSTQNFQLPVKRVYPASNSSDVSPPPPEPVLADTVDTSPNNEASSASTDTVAAAQSLSITQDSNNCIARDRNGLVSCVANARNYQSIDIANNIRCDNNCCPNGQALINLNNVQGLEIKGHGHQILRAQNQRQCSLLDIASASNILVNDVVLDDDASVGGCQVDDKCPRMVHVRSSNNIQFIDSHVRNGKGYAFYVQGTNGFQFENGSLTNSGVLGMYIGHGNDASSNIQITGSTFSDNQTNGLALLGVTGNSISDNLVANNVFVRNHYKGQWQVAPKYGTGYTGGGQLYVAQASNVTVRNNVVKDGFCDNCFIQRVARTGVSGIELGIPNQATVSNALVTGNRVINLDGFGISQNSNAQLSNVTVRDNQMLNTTNGMHISDAQVSGNRVINTQQFSSFEQASDFSGTYEGSVQCSSGGDVQRQCGQGSRFGQCAAQLKIGTADCSATKAELLGPNVAMNAGQSVVADGWVRNPVGQWCVRFADVSGNQISEQCQNLSNSGTSNVQSFVGLPQIDATAPSGTRSARLHVYHERTGTTMLVDDIKLSIGQ